jgi:hypothetical protein
MSPRAKKDPALADGAQESAEQPEPKNGESLSDPGGAAAKAHPIEKED